MSISFARATLRLGSRSRSGLWPPQRCCWDGHSLAQVVSWVTFPRGYFLTVTEEKVSAVSGLATRPCTLSLTTRAGGEWLMARPGR